jgi:lipopolysaccharide transport system permease protein
MSRFLREIWGCRYFWLSLVQFDLRAKYHGSAIGIGWSLLRPLAMTAIVTTVFHQLFDVSALEYASYALAGIACWGYFTGIASEGCGCLFRAEAYIRQCRVPLAIYPLRIALGYTFHLLLTVSMVLLVSGSLHGFSHPASLVSLIPSLLLLFIFGWGVAAIAGLANVYFRDTHHICDVAFQLLFYATPVLYPARLLEERRLGWVVTYNPLAAFLELIRLPILEGRVPSAATYGAAVLTVIAIVGLAALLFQRMQRDVVFRF